MSKKKKVSDGWETPEEVEEMLDNEGMAFPDAEKAYLRDVDGIPVMIDDYVERESELGKFIIIHAYTKDNRELALVTSAVKVMDIVKSLKEKDNLPVVVTFGKLRSKKNPKRTYWLVLSTRKWKELEHDGKLIHDEE